MIHYITLHVARLCMFIWQETYYKTDMAGDGDRLCRLQSVQLKKNCAGDEYFTLLTSNKINLAGDM